MKMLLATFSLLLAATAAKADAPGLLVHVGNVHGAVKVDDSRAVRAKIAGYMADFHITNYSLFSIGIGENFTVCFSVDSIENRNGIAKDLRALKLDADTVLSISPVMKCVREE